MQLVKMKLTTTLPGMILVRKLNSWKSMKISWNQIHKKNVYPVTKGPFFFYLFWHCPATFGIFLAGVYSWNQLNNWEKKKSSLHYTTVPWKWISHTHTHILSTQTFTTVRTNSYSDWSYWCMWHISSDRF